MSQQINLFNPLFRRKGFSPTSANAMLYGVGIVVVLTALYGVYQDNRTRDIARRAQEVNQKFSEATALREKLAAQLAQRKPNAELAAELNELEARLKGRQDIVEALNSGAVGTTGGYSEYMRAFSRQTVKDPAAASFKPNVPGPVPTVTSAPTPPTVPRGGQTSLVLRQGHYFRQFGPN